MIFDNILAREKNMEWKTIAFDLYLDMLLKQEFIYLCYAH